MSDTTPPNAPETPSFHSSDDTPVAPPPPARSGASARTWIIAGVVTAIVVVGVIWFMSRSDSNSTASSAAPAAAGQGGGRGFPGASGTITKINGSTITVKADDGTETKIVTNSDTTVTLSGDVKVNDIAVGDQLTVTGTVDGTNVTAERINDMGDVQVGQGRGQGGQNGQQDPNGTGNFTPPTDANGNIIGRGQGGQNGQQGGPNGSMPNGGSLPNGGSIPNGAPGGQGGGMTAGQVTAVDGNTITMTGRNGSTYTVTLSSSTTITKSRIGKVSDLKVGDIITAFGQSASNGELTATRISQGALGAGGGNLGVAGGRGGRGQDTTTTTR